MSQPPPPPGNPPEFGKSSDGAVPPPPGPPQAPQPQPQQQPQNPPQGYGYPLSPPAGGYGYPAAGPPPAAGNPYAQPVPPAQNPYAQAPAQAAFPPQGPPPPYAGAQPPPPFPGQPQYGQVPPQGPYGYPAPQPYPGAPGGGRSNSKLLIVVAAVVAAVLVIGGGVYLATKGSGDSKPGPGPVAQSSSAGPTAAPHSTQLQFGWDKPADKVAEKDNLKTVFGIWFTDRYVVKQQIDKVVAYDLGTGNPAWTLPAASRGDCAAAKDTYKNLAAIQYGPSCNQVMAFDLTTGVQKWSAKLPGATGSKTDFDYSQMAISGDTVGVDWLSGSIGYRLSTQAVLWQGGNGNCEDDGYAGGSQFVVIVNCDFKTYKVQVIDPENHGKSKWSWEAPTGTEVNAIVSTDPVVVVLGTENSRSTDVVTLVGGRMQSRISLGTDKYDISLGDNGAQDVHNILVSKDTVYLTLRSQGDSKGQVLSGIVAFNTSDGKQKWVAKPADKEDIVGLDFVDGQVLALEPPDYDVPGQLVTIDPANGAMKKYAGFADGASDHVDISDLENYPYWHAGHFFVACHTVYEGNDDQKYLVEYH
ncbi:PQQ-binding-like beta-propeller repeat protein [Actinacidiphila paucisporea]|uniref:PQQ-like domain-containing protein n=1 Tax=Actinacidiphila paucisporea TaxID=310782 RepID=A0A1M7F092_9ACTN|nr:PQQ-binding-like beta-propeller repeat protein [Actinacidiphila paucisporea]SHL97524.1 PQQ-like domain-containing protein [Actinacidiphila paucisporea]